MRWRLIAGVSLGVNLALAVLWWESHRHSGANLKGGLGSETPTVEASAPKTNLVVRRQFFSWQEVESSDYATYIENLRSIGCPEQTIRDIIIADVNALYAKRLATEVVTPEQQWWRTSPDTNVLREAAAKVRALDEERRSLLARLLGPAWEGGDLVNLPRPAHSRVALDGPVLAALPVETKQAVETITAQSVDRLQAYVDEQRAQGKNPDPAELAKLRQQTRAELQKVLSPVQLEEFLLRYSQDAVDLRAEFGQLQFFNPTPDEFRAVFRAIDSLDEELSALTGNDPATVAQRKSLEDQRDQAIELALGPDRYQEYRMLQDPLYREAVAEAGDGATPDAVEALYAIKLAAQEQQDAIMNDTNLTAEQKQIELKQLELDQLKANTVATGGDLPPEPAAQPQQPPPRKVYVLGPGDSAATIAMMYGIPVSELTAANPGLNLNNLRPGDAVTIPRATPLRPSFTPNAPPPVPFPPQ